ncbi:Small integral membrane protein 19 [Sciurus carolinensis]|uniref:Small integral membrane protein 19 n=1 Tax=Sciurus carolinensis TaxID=30640 RepID=A0AA41N573_SCICA|nr:Small integral membrane protein 19 [Sciurus carolinensis]
MAGSYGVMGDDGSIDYTVHEAWNEATNVYLIVILVSFGLFMYAKRNKRKIMRIFSVPPTEEMSEPNFYDTMSKIRLRQQLEMYSICNYKAASTCEINWMIQLLEDVIASPVAKHLSTWGVQGSQSVVMDRFSALTSPTQYL